MNDSQAIQFLRSRIADYEKVDVAKERERLIQMWRAAHPDAAAETSSYLKPLMLIGKRTGQSDAGRAKEPDEEWANDTYHVTVRRWAKDQVFGSDGGMVQIGISSHDGTARHDWRDFQAIKNQLAGPEVEGFELFPAESRLLDPSNYYTIWCFPGLRRLRVGGIERDVRDADRALAPQRALPKVEP